MKTSVVCFFDEKNLTMHVSRKGNINTYNPEKALSLIVFLYFSVSGLLSTSNTATPSLVSSCIPTYNHIVPVNINSMVLQPTLPLSQMTNFGLLQTERVCRLQVEF